MQEIAVSVVRKNRKFIVKDVTDGMFNMEDLKILFPGSCPSLPKSRSELSLPAYPTDMSGR